MIKKLAIYVFITLFFLSSLMVAFAHPTAAEHNKELEEVLLGNDFSKYKSEKIKNSIKALEYASVLTIDQFGGNGEEQFKQLKAFKITGIPLRFSSIDYSIQFYNENR